MSHMDKAVITITVVDKYGEKTLCHLIHNLDEPISIINDRINDLLKKGFDITGNYIIQFVRES